MSAQTRPASLTIAALATGAMAVFFFVWAVLSLSAGHGTFSVGIALALLGWGVLIGAAAGQLYRRSAWARGPVVAAGLLHLAAFGQFALNQPWALLGAAAALVATVAAVWPSTRLALTPDA